jgi:hypothetical protein
MEITFPDGVTVNVHDVIVLARKSQKIKGRGQVSIESQDEDAREWAQEIGLNVTATVPDIASGTKAIWDRANAKPWVTQPDLMSKYQGIVAAKHDRISREGWRDEGDLRRWAENNHKALFLVEKELRWPPRQDEHYNDDVAAWNREAEDSNREWNKDSRRWKRTHRKLTADNYLVGKAPYGYRIMGADCQQVPCRCFEQKIDDHKTLAIYEPEAKIVRDVVTRYLAGESMAQICVDYPWWVPPALARLLRNPSLAGRRMNAEGKTILRFKGIITWQTHLELVKRLDSRTHRKGISPANTYMLTGSLTCEAGHAMYADKGGNSRQYTYRCRECRFAISLDQADEHVSNDVIDSYGHLPHLAMRVIPGKNHFEDIAKLRQDRNELDDTQDDYEERVAEITAEIRRLRKLDEEQPASDDVKWVGKDVVTGDFIPLEEIANRNVIKIKDHWKLLSIPGRRDWLKENSWKVTAIKDPEMPNGWRLTIDAGWTADIGGTRQSESLGFPVREYWRYLASLPETLGIKPTGKDEQS